MRTRSQMNRIYLLLSALTVVLLLANIFIGSVTIPFQSVLHVLFGGEADRSAWTIIILQSRIPQAWTALLSGAALAVSGLILQTLFRNPLADPSILGISAGANLGVALVILSTGGILGSMGALSLLGSLAVIIAAFIGAFVVLILILFFASRVRSNVLLLIIGIMIGYIASSAISFLNFFATSTHIQSFVLWGMGDFSGVSSSQIPLFTFVTLAGIVASLLLIKPLNALLLGENYAANLGIRVKQARWMILLTAGLLTAVVTAYCGPISFIGLSVPHVARLLLGTSNHKQLLPVTILTGGMTALLCNLISAMPGHIGVLPLNAITPLIGAPVIIYVIMNRKNIHYFN